MTHAYTSWIDIPVVEAIEYFTGILQSFYNWGNHYAFAIATIGLCWSAFKLINSRFTIRDFWWDTIYKWLLFLLMMAAYPAFTMGLSAVANRIGIDAGNGKQAIIDSLTSMKKSIETDLAAQKQMADQLKSELESDFEGFTYETDFASNDDYNSYLDSLSEQINVSRFASNKSIKQAQEKIEECKKELNLINGVKICPACGCEMPVENNFCISCGNRYDGNAEQPESGKKFCPSCGKSVDKASIFCNYCGNRI